MTIVKLIQNKTPILLDGSIGALLIARNLGGPKAHRINVENPDILTQIHRNYLNAGCDIILTNTFNITPETLIKTELGIKEIVTGAVSAAKKAVSDYDDRYIGLNLGPSGKIFEPIGTSPYQEAYKHFKAQIEPVKNDIDLIVIETISDLTEMDAAINAVRDICNLPIFAAMTFTEKMKTWLGVSLDEWATFANSATIDVAGINCTLTPNQMLPVIKQFKEMVDKPLFAEPNRGQPERENTKTVYRMSADRFAQDIMQIYDNGIHIIGGCCGSDPECMRIIRKEINLRK